MVDVREYRGTPFGFIAMKLDINLPDSLGFFDTLDSVREDEEKYFGMLQLLISKLCD